MNFDSWDFLDPPYVYAYAKLLYPSQAYGCTGAATPVTTFNVGSSLARDPKPFSIACLFTSEKQFLTGNEHLPNPNPDSIGTWMTGVFHAIRGLKKSRWGITWRRVAWRCGLVGFERWALWALFGCICASELWLVSVFLVVWVWLWHTPQTQQWQQNAQMLHVVIFFRFTIKKFYIQMKN